MEQPIPPSSENISDATQTSKKEWVKPEMTEMTMEGGDQSAASEGTNAHSLPGGDGS